MRVGTRTALGRKYAPVGTRPLGKQRIGYEYLYLYVSIKPMTGAVFACFLPRLDKVSFNLFISERSKQLTRPTLLIVDGSGGASSGKRKSAVKAVETARLLAGVKSGGAFFSRVATQVEVSGV